MEFFGKKNFQDQQKKLFMDMSQKHDFCQKPAAEQHFRPKVNLL